MGTVQEIAEQAEELYGSAAQERERREQLECALSEMRMLLEGKPRWFRCLWYGAAVRRIREIVDEVMEQIYAR